VPGEAPLGGSFDYGSFRDPASRVLWQGDRVLRALTPQGWADWQALSQSRLFKEWTAAGHLVETTPVDGPQPPLLEHQRIPFWSYPYEWSFSMLADAARLQLELLTAALTEELTLKDATPYNIQFRGSRPVFIDIGSFRPYPAGEPWLGYGQFCRTFLYPLLVQAHAGVPFQPLLRASLDGISAPLARALLDGRKLLNPGVLVDVALQARAEASWQNRATDLREEIKQAGFSAEMISRNLTRLRKVVDRTRWEPPPSAWSEYAGCGHVASQRQAQTEMVAAIAGQRNRQLVWDLGANDGHFARVAAPHAEWVVAVDGDEVVIEHLYRSLRQEGPVNILPLVANLADLSPGWGWRGRERRSFEERARPDLVLMLAVIHHLVISANLPLGEVIDWLASLHCEVVFEWVPPSDPMARRLMLNKRPDEIHPDYDEESLRRLIDRYFEVRLDQPIEGRRLFHLTPRL
jgi:hypothetical protein